MVWALEGFLKGDAKSISWTPKGKGGGGEEKFEAEELGAFSDSYGWKRTPYEDKPLLTTL